LRIGTVRITEGSHSSIIYIDAGYRVAIRSFPKGMALVTASSRNIDIAKPSVNARGVVRARSFEAKRSMAEDGYASESEADAV
jgi:hypothetical protein